MADWCREARLGKPLSLNPKAYKSQTDTSLTCTETINNQIFDL